MFEELNVENIYVDATNEINFSLILEDGNRNPLILELPRVTRDKFLEMKEEKKKYTKTSSFLFGVPQKWVSIICNDFDKYESRYKGLEGMKIDEDFSFLVGGSKRVYPNRYYVFNELKNKRAKYPMSCILFWDEEKKKYLLNVDDNICGEILDVEKFENFLMVNNIKRENVKDLNCKIIGDGRDEINESSVDYIVLVYANTK